MSVLGFLCQVCLHSANRSTQKIVRCLSSFASIVKQVSLRRGKKMTCKINSLAIFSGRKISLPFWKKKKNQVFFFFIVRQIGMSPLYNYADGKYKSCISFGSVRTRREMRDHLATVSSSPLLCAGVRDRVKARFQISNSLVCTSLCYTHTQNDIHKTES